MAAQLTHALDEYGTSPGQALLILNLQKASNRISGDVLVKRSLALVHREDWWVKCETELEELSEIRHFRGRLISSSVRLVGFFEAQQPVGIARAPG